MVGSTLVGTPLPHWQCAASQAASGAASGPAEVRRSEVERERERWKREQYHAIGRR